jgi:hypothetical protein
MTEEFVPTTEMLAARYCELREELSQLKSLFDAETAALKEMQDAISEEMSVRLTEAGATSLKTRAGTITKKLTTKYNLSDSGEFMRFIRESARPELLQARLSTTALQEMLDNGEPLPPGVASAQAYSIVVRKS